MRSLSSLCNFCRPVPDTSLTTLAPYQFRAAHMLVITIVVVMLVTGPLEAVLGTTTATAVLVNIVVSFPLWIALARAVKQQRSETPDRFILFIGVLLVLQVSGTTWLTPENSLRHLDLMLGFPLILAAIVVMRPGHTLALGALTVIAHTTVWRLHDSSWGPDIWLTITNGALFTGTGMLASQLIRRVWQKRSQLMGVLQASERMRQLGVMTSGIAHELKTPLAAVDNALLGLNELNAELRASIGHPEVTEDDLREIAAELDETLTLATRGNRRMATFIDAMRQQTRGLNHRGAEVRFNVAEAIHLALTLLGHRIKDSGIRVDTDAVEPDLFIEGDPGRFEQVITNLVENAIHAIHEAGQRDGLISIQTRAGMDGVHVFVEDNGPGVPEAIRDAIFDMMFSTRSAQKGTGLGLTLCRDIVEGDFSGHITCEPPEHSSRGARFSLYLRDTFDGRRSSLLFIPRMISNPSTEDLLAAVSEAEERATTLPSPATT